MRRRSGARAADALSCLLIAAAVIGLFRQVTGHGFTFDDDVYVTAVPAVRDGLTAAGVRWAFTTTQAEFWHPLTWLSLMLDRSLFGPGPFGFHLTALLLHLASSVLLFLAARRLTGRRGASLLAAALFALHPQHVQVFAWVADRKDVLAGFFCLLFLLAWRSYAARPRPARYLAAAALFALGLMAKPSLVTLPLLLLVLDWWPLGRLRRGPGGVPPSRLLAEKAPLLLLSLAATAAGYWAEASNAGVAPLSETTLYGRVSNALVSLVDYLRMTVWPSGIAAFYPHPGDSIPPLKAAAALLLLAAATALLFRRARREPQLLAGWLWFGGMLAPVLGLVQVGNHAMADRYVYLPHLLLFVGCAWDLSRRAGGRPGAVRIALAASLAVLAAFAVVSRQQAGYWRDSLTLFTRAHAVTADNWFTRLNLGSALLRAGDLPQAERHFRAILAMPHRRFGYPPLALATALQGRLAEAEAYGREGVRLNRRDARARDYLAWILFQRGRPQEAEALCREAIALDPLYAGARINLGMILASQGRPAEARALFEEALRIDPGDPQAHANLERLRGR